MKQLDVTGISRRDVLSEEVLDNYNNINNFCKIFGLDYGAIYRYINNDVRISDKVARKLESLLNKPEGYLDQKIPSIATAEIPVISSDLGALTLAECLEKPLNYSGIDRVTLKNYGWSADSLFILVANDSSMEPIIKDKAEVIIDRSKTEIENNKFYAIRIDSTILIRKILKSPLKKTINLIPENQINFPAEEVNMEDPRCEVLGKVIYLKVAL